MFSWLKRIASACWRPLRRYARMNKDDGDGADDSLLWCRDLDRHSLGEFSFAVVQANEIIEDHSQVETGPHATFVGVYDGHGGPEASRFVRDKLFLHLMKRSIMEKSSQGFVEKAKEIVKGELQRIQAIKVGMSPTGLPLLDPLYIIKLHPLRLSRENGTISEDVLKNAFSATEDGFLALVRRTRDIKPLIAAVGSCCLVGVIWRGTLFIANLGDSRAVLGCLGRSNNVVVEQLTRDHNASMEEVRQELRSLHADDSNIVVLKHGVWRVKGIIQISRSIGDAYLKKPEFTIDPLYPRFRLSEPLRRPVLSAEPSIYSRPIQPQDKFLIFASDGLWEHMTNQEAAEIVHNYPREGIARRLVRTALNEAARKREMRYDDLKKVEKGVRRFFHDDITVIVVFLDHELLGKQSAIPGLSIRGFMDTVGPSDFSALEGINVNPGSVI